MMSGTPAPVPEGMETTDEMRMEWLETIRKDSDTAKLLRDLDCALAQIARLTERVAYFEREYQDSVSRTEAIENVETAKAEVAWSAARIAELEAKLRQSGQDLAAVVNDKTRLEADSDYWMKLATRNMP